METQQAEKVLNAIPSITIFGKPDCRFCDEAKKAFTSVELPFEVKMLEEELCLGENPETGAPRKLRGDWRTNGMIDLLSKWTMCNNPIPLIVIDGVGYPNLSAALDSISYRDRKKAIIQRNRDGAKANTRTDS